MKMLSTLTEDGRLLKIVFKHTQFLEKITDPEGQEWFIPSPQPIPDTNRAYARALTNCFIYEGPRENEVKVAEGFSYCSVADNFDKETGRQIALNRALSTFNKADRGALLQTYYSRPRNSGKRVADVLVVHYEDTY
jgi:hypothetical protein